MNEKMTKKEIAVRDGLPFGRTTPLEVLKKIGNDGLSGGIKEVCMFPTYRCNLSCYMCHVQHTRKKAKTELPVDDIKSAFDHLNVETMFHLGGESFARKDVMDIFRYIDSLGTKQIISTNGTLITDEIIAELGKLNNLVCMQVSLNGLGDIDNQIRGSPNAYEKTVDAIKKLLAAGIPTWIHATILNENIKELPKIVKLGAELGVGMVNFLFGQVMSQEEADETKELVEGWLGDEVVVGGYIGELEYSEEELLAMVDAAKAEAKKTGMQVMWFPRIFGLQPELYYRGTLFEQEGTPVCQMCLLPPLTPIVGPEGDVFGCCIVDKVLGNIKEKPLEEIWDGEIARKLRMGMVKDGMMPLCKRCPSGDLLVMSKENSILTDPDTWKQYIEHLASEMNAMTQVIDLLKEKDATLFQYRINDKPELNYWQIFQKTGMSTGMGEYNGDGLIKLIHKMDFDTLIKVNSGESNPIQATMAGQYVVEGDMAALMDLGPILPLQVEAHKVVLEKL